MGTAYRPVGQAEAALLPGGVLLATLALAPPADWLTQSDGLQFDSAEGAAVFSGRVTTDGGGGFASLRSDPWDGYMAFGAAKGVRLMVKGDGRQYKINAKVGLRELKEARGGAWAGHGR